MKSEIKRIEKEYLEKLVKRIIELRTKREMSQEKLAYASDISRSLMRGYEVEKKNISFANLIRIIKVGLNMTVEDFFAEGFDLSEKKSKKK